MTVLVVGENGTFPNNPSLPVLVYRRAFDVSDADAPRRIEDVFHANGWSNGWRNGVYAYHHFHSTAHEVLGCYSGHARVELGGPDGTTVDLAAGDVLLVPVGVSHKRIAASRDFAVVGCYADGRDYDMNSGEPSETNAALSNIRQVPMPKADPVYGRSGPLAKHWGQSHTDQRA